MAEYNALPMILVYHEHRLEDIMNTAIGAPIRCRSADSIRYVETSAAPIVPPTPSCVGCGASEYRRGQCTYCGRHR